MMGHLKTGLVLEGGAMRGMFTAGVLDVFMEHGVHFDGVIGVSAGAVFGPEAEANAVARRMRTGSIYVNYGQWDVKAPFGGYKQSGIGREGAVEGYEEFLEVKTIYDREGE